MTALARNSPNRWAQGLGVGGLIPFAALTTSIWFASPEYRALASTAMNGYGACIVSFLGAIHWGLTMREPHGPHAGLLIWGVIPSLLAWAALLLPPTWGLAGLAVVLWICFAVDRRVYPTCGVRHWLPMRFLLTVIASLCCAAGAWGTSQ